jgi:hypothetical protein
VVENGRVVKFRYNAAAAVAGLVAALGAVPLAAARWWYLPILLIPAGFAVWAWRAGTDAGAGGLRVRALLGSRQVPWSWVDTLVVGGRNRVYARSRDGATIRLTAVTRADLPRLIAASGQELRASSPQ